jgi:hypothetical protein
VKTPRWVQAALFPIILYCATQFLSPQWNWHGFTVNSLYVPGTAIAQALGLDAVRFSVNARLMFVALISCLFYWAVAYVVLALLARVRR